MWLGAFPGITGVTLSGFLSLTLVAVAMVLSVVAFARAAGPQYELRGSRAGVLLAIVGILSYLIGTSLQSAFLHVFSIALFYWGCVLYLGGLRSLISTLPCGLVVLSLFAPVVYGVWGLIYLDGLSWAIIVASMGVLWQTRSQPRPPGCDMCTYFEIKRESFCLSCGRLIGPLVGPSSRRFLGFAVFVIAMLGVLSLTVPVLTVSPTVSMISFGLGGPQTYNHFAPLQGWSVTGLAVSGNGTLVDDYHLADGRASLEALVATSQSPGAATAALNLTNVSPISASALPASIAQSMAGYTVDQRGTGYVGLDGVFRVEMLNGSKASSTFVAIVLQQTASSFSGDHGATLYLAGNNIIGWASASGQWSGVVQGLLYTYQSFSQAAYACSLAGFGVILFTISRDDELARTRRLESTRALGEPEKAVLRGFVSSPRTGMGAQIREGVRRSDPWVSDSAFYSSMEELSRRGLVSSTVLLQNGSPRLLWKCLV
jgi:hypothetical protein